MNHLMRANQDRGRPIAELEAAKRKLEAAQQREAELAVLRERERMARDLHDSLGHALVALSVQLEAIQRLYRVDPELASTQMDELKGLTRSSMDALRRSVAGLRAPGLGDRALRPALQALCVEVGQRAALQVNCQVDEIADQLRPVLAEALGKIGDTRALEPLIAALGDTNHWVRTAIVEAQGKIGDARAAEPLTAFREDRDQPMRMVAIKALDRIGASQAADLAAAA